MVPITLEGEALTNRQDSVSQSQAWHVFSGFLSLSTYKVHFQALLSMRFPLTKSSVLEFPLCTKYVLACFICHSLC